MYAVATIILLPLRFPVLPRSPATSGFSVYLPTCLQHLPYHTHYWLLYLPIIVRQFSVPGYLGLGSYLRFWRCVLLKPALIIPLYAAVAGATFWRRSLPRAYCHYLFSLTLQPAIPFSRRFTTPRTVGFVGRLVLAAGTDSSPPAAFLVHALFTSWLATYLYSPPSSYDHLRF